MSKRARIARLINKPIPPWLINVLLRPSQKIRMIVEEKMVAPTITGRHQDCSRINPVAPTTKIKAATMKVTAARMKVMLDSHLLFGYPIILENTHEPSGHTIPGCSSKSFWLCPKYNKCTKPCKIMNTPITNLPMASLLKYPSPALYAYLPQ
jgi:hypothetical protein